MSSPRQAFICKTREEYIEKHLGIPQSSIKSIVPTMPRKPMKHKSQSYNYYKVITDIDTTFEISIFKTRDEKFN